MDRNIWLDGMMGLIVGDAYNIPTGTWSDDGSGRGDNSNSNPYSISQK